MAIAHQCRCGKVSHCPDSWIGTLIKCPSCGESQSIGPQAAIVRPETIRVACRCGQVVHAPAGSAGKHGKCPGCGTRLLIEEVEVELVAEPSRPAFEHPVDITVGRVQALFSTITVTFHLDPHGCTYLQIATSTDHGRSNPFTLVRLGDVAYDELVKVLGKADELVKRFRNSGPGRQMTDRPL